MHADQKPKTWGIGYRNALETGETAALLDRVARIDRRGDTIDASLDERGRTLLMESALAGRSGFVHALIWHGANVERRDVSGYTALLLARDFNTAKVLIEAGAHVDAAATNGVTSLLIAAQRGELELVRLLLSSGADADAANRHGVTPLMRAAEHDHVAVVGALLDAGADPDQADRWGRRASDHLPGSPFATAA
ncbi:MAG: ankyrin repeat domain-containing protein [Nannocystaceae bacterium]